MSSKPKTPAAPTVPTSTIPAREPVALRLFKFGAPTCSACVAMDKARTLEKFADKHPDIEIVKYELTDAEGEARAGTEFARNSTLADAYEVQALPTLVIVGKDGGILQAFEGGAGLAQLDKLYAHAKVMLDTIASAGVAK
jgi:thiol-disulfide isomerase/thioredoxin